MSLWRQLKQRGVLKTMAMYAATAFIVMEAGDIMLPRLGLPDWSVTALIIVLILGMPVAFVLSWIFDITQDGVVRTEARVAEDASERSGPDSAAEPDTKQQRKLRLSDVVIALLLAVVAILVYPRIFGSESYRLKRELGEKISIAVMPFKNMTGDSIYQIWQDGLQNLVITALSNSEELAVRQFETMNSLVKVDGGLNYASLTPSLSGELARRVEANTVVLGNIYRSGEKLRITANTMNAETGEVYRSWEMESQNEDELFSLADSLSLAIRNYLEIKKISRAEFKDQDEVYTHSAEAYKLYLQGFRCHAYLDYACAVENYTKALELDSCFVPAMIKLAYCHGDLGRSDLAGKWAKRAYDHLEKLPLEMQLMVRSVRAATEKRPLEQLGYAQQYLELYPHSAYMKYVSGWLNFNLHQWEAAIEDFERKLELMDRLNGRSWAWTYILLGEAYHHTGSHKKEHKVFEEGKELWPGQLATFCYWQAICAASRGDSTTASTYLEEMRRVKEQNGWSEANILLWYAGVHAKAGAPELAEKYYREVLRLAPDDPACSFEFAEFLVREEIHLDVAAAIIAPLVEQYPDHASNLYLYGKLLYLQGDLDQAVEKLQLSWDQRAYYDHDHFLLLKEVRDQLAAL